MVGTDISSGAATPVLISLPDRLDTSAAPTVHATLAQHAGSDIQLDFKAVEMLGALCLQLLLNLRHHWQAAGQSVMLANMSPEISKALADFGTNPAALTTEGMQ